MAPEIVDDWRLVQLGGAHAEAAEGVGRDDQKAVVLQDGRDQFVGRCGSLTEPGAARRHVKTRITFSSGPSSIRALTCRPTALDQRARSWRR